MAGILTVAYGVVAYLVFFASFLYAIGFVGNIAVPKSIDSGSAESFWGAVIVNSCLLGLFAVQHNVMARPAFKQWWTRIIPPAIERSTFVLLSSLLLFLLYWKWQPIQNEVWRVENQAGQIVLLLLFWAGWLIVLVSTFLINHFDLFGLRQVYLRFVGQPYSHLKFRATSLYSYVRHPIMLGFVIAFWATPTMTGGHLLFAGVTTAWILFSLKLEEKDLRGFHGDIYGEYQREVPMIIPWRGRSRRKMWEAE